MPTSDAECPCESMDAESPLFILYTSGSTGKAKGLVHTTGGYLVYTALTFKTVFQYQQDDIFWCTADIGWITGHSYLVYGPLLNGATIVLSEGVPSYPTVNRMAAIIDKHQVNILYTAPTMIRTLMTDEKTCLEGTTRSSLKVMGSVGEPINPEVWRWYKKYFGNNQCPIVDTWWQTETGGFMITPIAGITPEVPGCAGLPFFGIKPDLVDDEGKAITDETKGNLIIKNSWPGQARTILNDNNRFKETYFSRFEGAYYTGDGAIKNKNGYYQIIGRVDDVLNVSGHRLGTAELESALVSHVSVSEAAVIGIEHPIKGETIYAFVTLKKGVLSSEDLKHTLKKWVRKEISAIAEPEYIQWTNALPKTRSGKIMRRILRQLVLGKYDDIGDTSTLADFNVIDQLKEAILYHRSS